MTDSSEQQAYAERLKKSRSNKFLISDVQRTAGSFVVCVFKTVFQSNTLGGAGVRFCRQSNGNLKRLMLSPSLLMIKLYHPEEPLNQNARNSLAYKKFIGPILFPSQVITILNIKCHSSTNKGFIDRKQIVF